MRRNRASKPSCTQFSGQDGANPTAGLVAYKGMLYGTTASGGGENGGGALFKIDPPTGKESVVYSFAGGSAPHIPFADTDWGAMLLAKGDCDAAIGKFKLANMKGPHFADPLEMWGEALMLKNRSDLALAKFEEAIKYAPNWGRLHLKWGEALAYAGKESAAQRQFTIASSLDLGTPDRSELARARKSHG
jgi:uncharacterized repeat protein (TIGR03803 family)